MAPEGSMIPPANAKHEWSQNRHRNGYSQIFKNALAFLPRRAGCEAPSYLRVCDPPEAFILHREIVTHDEGKYHFARVSHY